MSIYAKIVEQVDEYCASMDDSEYAKAMNGLHDYLSDVYDGRLLIHPEIDNANGVEAIARHELLAVSWSEALAVLPALITFAEQEADWNG